MSVNTRLRIDDDPSLLTAGIGQSKGSAAGSVGAVAAISGSWASMYIIDSGNRASVRVVLTAVAVALLMALVAGAWNGFLVSVLGIQPIVATLVLMVAGRGLAQVITNEKILYPDNSPAYKLIGGGYWLAVPFSILVAGAIFGVTALLTQRTALGTLIEAVGVNPEASRLAGVKSRSITGSSMASPGSAPALPD